MKPHVPVDKTYCPQEDQNSQDHNQMPNGWGSMWQNRVPIGAVVNLYPGLQETDVQHQEHAAGVSPRMVHSPLFSGESLSINASFFYSQQSFQNTYQTQSSISGQSEVISFNMFEENNNSNMESPFQVAQMNLFERTTNQSHSLFQQPSLRHEQLQSDFLNRELLDFDTELLESTGIHLPNAEITVNFTENAGIELEQSNEASQFSVTNVEENSINHYEFSISDIWIDGSNQTSDMKLEQSNHSAEFHSQCSFVSQFITETKELWNERGQKLKNEQKNRNEKNNCITADFENWIFSHEYVVTLDEARRLRLTSGASVEPDRLSVIEDVPADTVINQVVDRNNPKLGLGPVVFDNHDETLFYESTIKEIDAIDSVLSSVERKMNINSNSYDLDRAKNIETFQYLTCIKRRSEAFILETVEITVMPLTIQPGDPPLSPETIKLEESSQTLDPGEQSGGSNIPGTSTALEKEPCQETSSQREQEKHQFPHEVANTTETSTAELSSLAQIQIGLFSANADNPQGDNVQEKTKEGEPEVMNLELESDFFGKQQRITPDNDVIQGVGKADSILVDKSSMISKVEEKSNSEGELENVISETVDTTALPPFIRPEHVSSAEIELQEKLEIHHSTGELSGPHILELSGETEMNPLVKTNSQSKTENDQPPYQDNSTKVSSAENIPGKGLEDEKKGVSLESGGPDDHLNKTIDLVIPLEVKQTETESIKDDSSLGKTIETKIKHSVMETGSINQETLHITALPSDILPEHQLPSETKTQETYDMLKSAAEVAESNTLETSTISDIHTLEKQVLQIGTNIDKAHQKEISSEVLFIDPTSLPQRLEANSFSSLQEDNIQETGSEDQNVSVGLEITEPDFNVIIGETQTLTTDNEKKQAFDTNDTIVVDEPVIFEKADESKIKADKQTSIALHFKEKHSQTDITYDFGVSTSTKKIETNMKHIAGGTESIVSETEGINQLPTANLSEHKSPNKTKTQENYEMQNLAVDLPKPNTSKSSAILEINPFEKKSSQNNEKVDQSLKKESSVEASSVDRSALTQTQHIPTPEEPSIQETIHDNIEIHISPSELAWLSEPEIQSEIRSHPCIEQLENFQIEQVPLSIDGMLQITMPSAPQNQECTEELSEQIYFEQFERSSLPDVSAMDKKNQSFDRSATSKNEHVHAVPQAVTPSAPLPQRSSMILSEYESTVVGFEPDSSTLCIGSQSTPPMVSASSSSGSRLVKQGPTNIDEPPDEAAPSAKKKRTVFKPATKLPVKETRKSSRIRRIPDRLFYIGRGQLF